MIAVALEDRAEQRSLVGEVAEDAARAEAGGFRDLRC